MIRFYSILFLLFILLSACRKGDKVPAYLEIDHVTVAAAAVPGSTTSRITDVWVYADDVLLGTWELPARIPVLKEGNTKITVAPGIKRNGMYDDRLRYPFYTWWNGELQLQKEGNTAIQPEVGYIAQADQWVEAFEDAGVQLLVSENSDTTFTRFTATDHPELASTLIDGSPAGGFVLDEQRRYMRLYTDEDLTVAGGPIFLELDYSTNVILTVGMMFNSGGAPQSFPYVYLVPTITGDVLQPSWNKVYIDLSPIFNQPISERDIYFEAEWSPSAGVARVYLDNIKLVRYQS